MVAVAEGDRLDGGGKWGCGEGLARGGIDGRGGEPVEVVLFVGGGEEEVQRLAVAEENRTDGVEFGGVEMLDDFDQGDHLGRKREGR